MKIIVALCLLAFPVLLFPAAKQSDANVLKTYVSPDGVFRFSYSQILFRCPQGNEPEDQSEPPGTCESQMSICDDDDDSTLTLACFGYPEMGATFAVAEVKEAKTEDACLAGPVGWPMVMHGTRIIHGVRFKVFEVSSAWTGGGLSGKLYRTFHLSKCYELGIRSVRSSNSQDDPDEVSRPTNKDAVEVRTRLEQPLKSFRFLK
jgi:hypothetical protein